MSCCGSFVVSFVATGGGGGGGGGGIAGVAFQEEGVTIVTSATANFVGAGATVTNVAGVATITIPATTWRDEGIDVVVGTLVNFVGAGVTVTTAAGVAIVTIPGGITGIAWQDEGGAVVTSATANFVGAGVLVTNVAGVATITIPGGITGVAWQEEGAAVVTSATANFVGPNTTVTNAAGVATITTRTPPFSPPEQWSQLNVTASQTNVALTCLVSQNFDNIKMIRAGSVVGLATRLSETITAGTLTVEVTLNGAAFGAPFTLVHTNASNQNGGVAIAAPGALAYAASDLLGIRLTTDAGFLPITTDLEAWLECVEAI